MKNSVFTNSISLLIVTLLLLLATAPGWAHTSLKSSVPADGQTVSQANQLVLEFGAPLRLMQLTLTDASAKEIALDFTRSSTAQARFIILTKTDLAASTYKVMWMGMGEDGHRMEGSFNFNVNPDASAASLSEATSSAPVLFSGLEHAAAKTVQAFKNALKNGDTDTLNLILADDVMIFEGGNVERSKAEYQKQHMAADIAYLKDITTTTLEHHVRVFGDTALSLAHYTASGLFKDKKVDGLTMETISLQLFEGNWQITHIHWSNK